MPHILDNPAWNALVSANSHLSQGNDKVRYFRDEVSPFAGLKEISGEYLRLLHELLPVGRAAALVTADEPDIPAGWKLRFAASLYQMTCENYKAGTSDAAAGIVPLTEEHVPQMLALTRLTHPGPFSERTIEFGHYTGIFQEDRLIAMAGQRLHAFHYSEISAVCTHPDHLGKGYGTALMRNQAERIISGGGIPFLHVRKDNLNAIRIYEQLGFDIRKEMNFKVLERL